MLHIWEHKYLPSAVIGFFNLHHVTLEEIKHWAKEMHENVNANFQENSALIYLLI